MKKLIVAFVVFFIIVTTFSTIRSVHAEQDFVDVPSSHWAYEAIHYMASMGIVVCAQANPLSMMYHPPIGHSL